MRWLGTSVSLILVLMWASPVEAARTLTIAANKSALFGDEELTVTTASMSGFIDGENIYIKGAFHQEGSSNYFGWTKKGDSWIKNGETTTNQRQVNVGSWDGTLVVKSDFSDSGYIGEGDYKFKVGFYYITSGGNVSSVNWSTNNLTISLSEPDPTPTPTPTSTSTPTPTSTPTSTPAPTIISTITPKPTASVASVLAAKTEVEPDSEVTVAAEVQATATPSATPQPETKKQGKWPWLMMIGGGGLAVAALFPFLRKWYHDPSWLKTLLKGGDRSSFGQE